MRIFKTKWFVRFARRERIKDHALLDAVAQAEEGLIDADLGSGLLKQRVARAGEGRSGLSYNHRLSGWRSCGVPIWLCQE